jgi:cyanophycinase
MSPSRAFPHSERGLIIPIGGAEDKVDDRTILRHFLERAGAGRARVVIIPTASEKEDTGTAYEKLFRELGAGSARHLPITTRADCEKESFLEALERATGIFLTGGNQLRLSTALGGTEVARTIRRANASGVVVAGTSAGAAFLSEHMIAGGEEGPTPRAGMVTLAPGLGLTNRVIIDQHFRQRDRLGRLLTALAFNPFAVGLGLDEDTCAAIGPDNVVSVVGEGAVTVVDAADVSFSAMGRVPQGAPISLIGVRLHVLVDGGRFDLETRTACAVADGDAVCSEAAEEER